MRIRKLSLPKTLIEELGLTEFDSNRISTTMCLVGKNGSGKTRYLNAITNKLKSVSPFDVNDNALEHLPNPITELAARLSPLHSGLKKSGKKEEFVNLFEESRRDNWSNNKAEKMQKFKSVGVAGNEIQMYENAYTLINQAIDKRTKVITPKDLRVLRDQIEQNDKKVLSFQDVIDSTSGDIDVNEFQMISESALTFLRRLPHRLAYDEIDSKGDEKKFKNRVAYKRYQLLSKLIKQFLDKELKWHAKTSNIEAQDDGVIAKTTGYWTIGNRNFNFQDFSEGEKVLFTYALLLFLLSINPRVKFDESIIVIDEPELNLHPKAQIRLIDSLQNLVKDKGQLIIATHSLSIVANLDYESIYLVRQSELLSPSSSVPFNSVDDLMGFDEHYHKIVEFLNSTPSWAMTHFMAQCFDDPEVIETASDNDPQVDVFKNLILKQDKLHILDYGSGKGRLLDKISESNSTWGRISNYDCFDIDDQYNNLVLNKGASNVYNDLKQIPNSKYDLVVLVNVLHEIRIDLWDDLLNILRSSLKPDGFLAIVEDTELPIGELPNDHGFLILGEEEMTKLLGRNTKFITPTSERYKNRIICGFAKKTDLLLISKYTIRDTLELLQENALKSIQELREENNQDNTKSGRLYGLHANHYVNVELAKKYSINPNSPPCHQLSFSPS